MTKAKTDVVDEAHRRLRLLSVDQTASADMITYGGAAADSLLEELQASPNSITITWTIDTIPEHVFRPFSWLVAADIAPHYEEQSEGRPRAMTRLRAALLPSDVVDRRDTDEDGTVDEDEAEAGKRTVFF